MRVIAAVMGTFEPGAEAAMMGTESTPTPASTPVVAHAAATGSCRRDEKPVTTATPSLDGCTDRCEVLNHRPTAASLKGGSGDGEVRDDGELEREAAVAGKPCGVWTKISGAGCGRHPAPLTGSVCTERAGRLGVVWSRQRP